MPQGVIVKGIGGFYYVQTDQHMYECKARGIFRKDGIIPLPGDRVTIAILDEEKKLGNLLEILPRISQLVRPQVANIDQVAVIISLVSPKPDFLLLDKLLVTAVSKNLKVMIALNKVDLVNKEIVEKVKIGYQTANHPIFPICAKSGEGMELFLKALENKISVFAGQSGVGKSTVINAIMQRIVMETGEVSEKIERGKHTTRHAELIQLTNGGYIVDTPGFSSYALEDIQSADLQQYYPDITEFNKGCKFLGCRHIQEPGCMVKEAVENGMFSKERYMRYVHLYQELIEKEKHRYTK